MPRPKAPRVQEGDVLRVPVCSDKYAAAIVLHVSEYIRNGMVLGFFPRLFGPEHKLQESDLELPFLETPKWTSKLLVGQQGWEVVGNWSALLKTAPPVIFRIGASLYRGDEPAGRVDADRWADYPEVLVWGGQALENHLRRRLCAESTPGGDNG